MSHPVSVTSKPARTEPRLTKYAWLSIAAAFIIVSAVQRLMHPREFESLGIGLLITLVATAVNGAVGFLLLRVGRTHRSATLVADGKHLLTDVWTSVGVVVGVGA